MTALVLVILLTLLLEAWLPPLTYEQQYFPLAIVVSVDCVVFMWWLLRMVRLASEQAAQRAALEQTLRRHTRARDALAAELARTRERVAELEQQATLPVADEPVVLSTPSQTVSFLPDDITYVDSLNRVRAIHFADGESIQMNMTLAQIAESLPEGRFAYCHRSVVVNLRHVRSVGASELTLDDGTTLPVSRRRVAELRETLSTNADTGA